MKRVRLFFVADAEAHVSVLVPRAQPRFAATCLVMAAVSVPPDDLLMLR